jgi:GH15 family glucan-1,4-alpha-glucosidase
LASARGDSENAVRWRTSAEDIALNAQKHLYNHDRQAFYKGLIVKNKEIIKNDTIDSSAAYGSFMFNLFAFDSPEMKNSVEAMVKTLTMNQRDTIGLARYENDYYNRVSSQIIGNPWFITTLWLAQYYHAIHNDEQAKIIVRWCREHMLASGVLPEQINPFTDQFVSVAPLAWSQAEYVSTLLDLI